jgi:hypothetical protein
LAALHRRVVQRRWQPQVILLTYGFHVSVALAADQLRSYASLNVGFECQPSSYVRLEVYGFIGLCEGE